MTTREGHAMTVDRLPSAPGRPEVVQQLLRCTTSSLLPSQARGWNPVSRDGSPFLPGDMALIRDARGADLRRYFEYLRARVALVNWEQEQRDRIAALLGRHWQSPVHDGAKVLSLLSDLPSGAWTEVEAIAAEPFPYEVPTLSGP